MAVGKIKEITHFEQPPVIPTIQPELSDNILDGVQDVDIPKADIRDITLEDLTTYFTRPKTIPLISNPYVKSILLFFAGLFLLSFGVDNAGGYYVAGSRLAGDAAKFFYVSQVANICQITGIVLMYHAIISSGIYGAICQIIRKIQTR